MLRHIRSRPFSSIVAGSITASTSYAFYVEHEANKQPFQKAENVLPREYDRDAIASYWMQRPISVVNRLSTIGYEIVPIIFNYVIDFKIFPDEDTSAIELKYKDHAQTLRCALTRLGPAFIKFGQQLSIRPDLLPPTVLKELQKLCDAVEPIPDFIAFKTIEEELGKNVIADQIEDMKLDLVAAASLGQVYQAKLKSSNQLVAIKVQRPDMIQSVSLDLFLLNQYGLFLDTLFGFLTEQVPFHVDFIDCFARGSYNELDYEKEAENQNYFRKEFEKRQFPVHIPEVIENMTSRRVITTEWIDGVKLADAEKSKIQELIPVGVELFLTQLLDFGHFHSDPHPGNLLVTNEGTLCLLDFGLCAEIDAVSRNAMTEAIVHLLNGDFDTLISRDAKDLGFLPQDMDVKELKPILTKILTQGILESGSNLHSRKRKLMGISNELNEVFFQYEFSVPPFFALITRGLGLLEGIALSGDPDFDIFKASLPYASKRAAKIYGARSFDRLLRRKNTSL
eukprot:CAMPEP_0178951312 /NCGR_PEP_ID=MMETSP0789-20121207/7151_1 /TAXON_ID=3005 /ORGANISM="Rhizosolenia setigera, Strain CCMP 1694" /LENGTH=508 /DNA_ID=CAMNT_0020632161 /DNA_START=42 /DNA_END=1568 /DNA_ORIENTATION=+